VFKTTASKAVSNGLDTYSLPTIGNKLLLRSLLALKSLAIEDYVSRFS
jgi:hypothetical protein